MLAPPTGKAGSAPLGANIIFLGRRPSMAGHERLTLCCASNVPVVVIVTGAAVSGPALLLGLADVVIMTDDAFAFVSGPNMVEEFTGVRMDAMRLGGASTHSRASGVATLQVADEEEGLRAAAAVLAYLPAHADEPPPRWPSDDPADRPTPELRALIPPAATGS